MIPVLLEPWKLLRHKHVNPTTQHFVTEPAPDDVLCVVTAAASLADGCWLVTWTRVDRTRGAHTWLSRAKTTFTDTPKWDVHAVNDDGDVYARAAGEPWRGVSDHARSEPDHIPDTPPILLTEPPTQGTY